MAKSTDRSETVISTVEVDGLVHFEAARIALRCHFEAVLDPRRADMEPPEWVSHPGIPRMTRLGVA
jgi:hypothetical protein